MLVLDVAIIIDIIEAITEFGAKLSLVLLSAKLGSVASESNLGGILLRFWHSGSTNIGRDSSSCDSVVVAEALFLGLFLLFYGGDVFLLFDVSITHGHSLKIKLIIDFLIR